MRDVPRDYHLPAAFSQPLGFRYHQTTGLMGRGGHSSGGKPPKHLFSRSVKNRVFWQEEGYGWLSIPKHSCHEQGREGTASEPNWAARKIKDLTTPSVDWKINKTQDAGMREGWREVKRLESEPGRVGMDWDNGFDQVKIKVSSQRKTEMPQPGKNQQPPIWDLIDGTITKQQSKLWWGWQFIFIECLWCARHWARLYRNCLIHCLQNPRRGY